MAIMVEMDEVEPKKHSIRYNCTKKDPPVSTIYINRSALPAVYPDKVTITIEWKE